MLALMCQLGDPRGKPFRFRGCQSRVDCHECHSFAQRRESRQAHIDYASCAHFHHLPCSSRFRSSLWRRSPQRAPRPPPSAPTTSFRSCPAWDVRSTSPRLPPGGARCCSASAAARRTSDLAFSGGGADVRNLLPIVDSMRVVKDADEIARLRRAVNISVAGHIAAMRVARPGMYEYELEATLEDGFRRNGADRLGYPSIVGSGPNSTTLHYDVNRRRTENGDLVVIDAAAEWGQYTADVTRTFPVNGKFSPRQKAIYDLVLGAQQAAFDAIRPGITMRELDGVARAYMHEHSGNLCGERTCDDREYFNHGLGHPIGMDVHDVGFTRPLEPGMVVTLEPGIYLQAEKLGVRIEDDVLVTAKGGEWLSDAAPRTTEAIERVMSHR